jgi:hypothetical protein
MFKSATAHETNTLGRQLVALVFGTFAAHCGVPS